MDYICYENAVTEINSNKPELPQEIACYEGNPIYDFLIGELYNLPTGADTQVPLLCVLVEQERKLGDVLQH